MTKQLNHFNIMYNIQPKDFTTTRTATKFKILSIVVELNQKASIFIELLDVNDSLINTSTIILEGEEYNVWGLNDEYILQKISEKLNLIII